MTQHQISSPVDIIGSNDHQPIRALWKALGEVATWPGVSSRIHADLTIFPVHELDATDDRWYELWWTHPGVAVQTTGYSPDDEDESGYLELAPIRIEKICELPAPPVIPVEQRLAALEPVGEVTVTDADRMFWGANAEAEKRDWLEGNRRTAVRSDRTTAIFDWAAYATRVAETLAAQPDRKLTAGQRASVALARYEQTRVNMTNARASVVGMISNAVDAGDLEPLAGIEGVIEMLDPTLASEGPVRKAIDATSAPAAPKANGRPAVGATISVAYPADLLARVDAAAAAAGLTRAAWLRQAATAEALRVENRLKE